MNAFKVVAIVILSVLLFFSLNILAAGITVDRTVLNSNFINSSIDKIDLPGVLEEAISDQPQQEMPSAIVNALAAVVDSREEEIKTSIKGAISAVYDYTGSGQDRIELAEILRSSLLSDQLLHAFIDELNIARGAKDLFQDMINKEVHDELKTFVDLPLAFEKALNDNETSIKNQLKSAASSTADYMVGYRDTIDARISISLVIDSLRGYLMEQFAASPPDYLGDVDQQVVTGEFNRLFEQFRGNLSEDIEIDKELLESLKIQFDQVIEDGEAGLSHFREFASIFRKTFIASIAAVLILGILIVLVHRNIPGSMLNLGIVFILCAVVVLITAIIGKNMVPQQVLTYAQAPAAIESWMLGLARSVFVPGIITGIVYLALGVVAGSVYFLLRRQEQS